MGNKPNSESKSKGHSEEVSQNHTSPKSTQPSRTSQDTNNAPTTVKRTTSNQSPVSLP